MQNISVVAIFLLFTGLLQTVSAGERMQYDVAQPDTQERVTLYLQGSQARISSSADQSTALIFNADQRKIHILDHGAKSITTVDQASLEQLASLAQGMGELAKSQGGVLGDIFKTFGLENNLGESADIEVKTLSGSKTYSGQSCQIQQIFNNGELRTQICLAGDLKLQAAEKETLDSLITFAQLILQQGQIILAQFSLPIPVLPAEALKGTPVYINDLTSKTTATLVDFKQMEVMARQFTLPEGYSRKVLSL